MDICTQISEILLRSAYEKTFGSSQVIQFAGITLYSLKEEARLPEEKLQKCRILLNSFCHRRKATLRELQSQ